MSAGYNGSSWSSTTNNSNGRDLNLYAQSLSTDNSDYRGHGLQLRCLSE
ncbi:hypothetical protein [uncultured Rikenella sp.]|nr:hypothetical protein [uncultured Rikenella sp.]